MPHDTAVSTPQTQPAAAAFQKILVPVDGSAQSARAAQTAVQLAKTQGAHVVGVYVIDPFPYLGIGDASAVGLQTYLAQAQAVAGEALSAVSQACEAQGVPFEGDTIERNVVYEGILETANAEGCDLIVMGSHGRQGLKALILGSVAQKVLTHASVPVLIVKA
jgi:nucleotide-binding universal stress UspA family protein